jgi:hypothetical protein
LGIDAPVVELEVVWHNGVPHSGSQVADFFVAGLKCPCKVVDTGMGSDGGASLHHGSKSIGHGSCNFAEFIPAEADEGFG